MPSTMTHAFMAKDIYNKLDKNIQKKIKLDDYITYSQGPDILYFYRIFLPFGKFLYIQKFGGVVHRKRINDFFLSITNTVKKTKDINQFNFLCGLLTHYIGDTTCHPLINYLDYKINRGLKRKKDYHFMVELYIDNYYINKKGYNYKTFPGYKLVFNAKKEKTIEEMLNNSFLEIYNEKNMGKIYYQSLKEMKFFFHYLRYDPYRIKRYIYNFLYLFAWYVKKDFRFLSYNFDLTKENNNLYLNLNHDRWFNVRKKDNTSVKSFEELYDEVINRSVVKIRELYNYIYNNKELDLNSFYGNLSYANGLPIK